MKECFKKVQTQKHQSPKEKHSREQTVNWKKRHTRKSLFRNNAKAKNYKHVSLSPHNLLLHITSKKKKRSNATVYRVSVTHRH